MTEHESLSEITFLQQQLPDGNEILTGRLPDPWFVNTSRFEAIWALNLAKIFEILISTGRHL